MLIRLGDLPEGAVAAKDEASSQGWEGPSQSPTGWAGPPSVQH